MSDHCIIWIDIPKEIFLGQSPKLHRQKPRKLKASDPRIVDRYIQRLRPSLHQHNLLQRMRKVNTQAQTSGWSTTLEQEYNDINQTQIKIRRNIEEKLRKLRTGGIPWSPTLQSHRDKIRALSLLLKKRNNRQVSNRLIRRSLRKTNLENAYALSVSELRSSLSKAFKDYKQARTVTSRFPTISC